MSSYWTAPDSSTNAAFLDSTYPDVLDALGQIDHFGHELLTSIAATVSHRSTEAVVGVALFRRAVTQFSGIRPPLHASSVQASALIARAHFETLLAFRYFVYGAARVISPRTSASQRARETRARYYWTAKIRREIYRRQALIDGGWGVRRIPKRTSCAIEDEIKERKAVLRRYFRRQDDRYSAITCGPSWSRKARYNDEREWYSFGFRKKKVGSIRQLAAAYGWLRDYELLYDAFSGFQHPRGISHDGEIDGSHFDVFSPHMAEPFETVAFFTAKWQMFIMTAAIRAWVPRWRIRVIGLDAATAPAFGRLHAALPVGFK